MNAPVKLNEQQLAQLESKIGSVLDKKRYGWL